MVLLPSKMVLPPSKMVLPPSKMVLPQAMAWVQYWFRVLSLKFCRKSKKICGDISPVSPAFLMYGVHSEFPSWPRRKFRSYHKSIHPTKHILHILIQADLIFCKFVKECHCPYSSAVTAVLQSLQQSLAQVRTLDFAPPAWETEYNHHLGTSSETKNGIMWE